ncbi:MAG: HlyD family secretion protein, partial [Archangium sp.]|nr:HlyD family secretion protein [Archangium sp.]
MLEPLSPNDVVPTLRADLVIADAAPGRGEDEVRVADPSGAQVLMLKGFEVSLARMLNGRRTASEVVTAAQQIGLPLSVDGLNGFLRKLNHAGFLTKAGASAPADITSWTARAEWPEEVRHLFQEALFEARADRLSSAKAKLDALLIRSPATPEAQQLLHWVMQRLHPNGPATPAFSSVFANEEKQWFAEGAEESDANDRAANAALVEASAMERQLRGGSSKKWLIPVVLVMVAAAVAFVPVPSTASAPYQVQPKTKTNVTVTQVGTTLKSIDVKVGQWVTKGTVLAQWNQAEAEAALRAAEKQLEAGAGHKKGPLVPAAKVAAAKAAVAKATAAEKKAQVEHDKLKAKSRGKKVPALLKAQKKLSDATAARTLATQALALVTAPAAPAGDVEALKQAVAAAKAKVAVAPVTAPADGFVAAISATANAPIDATAPLFQLEDTRSLAVVVTLPDGVTVQPGASVAL